MKAALGGGGNVGIGDIESVGPLHLVKGAFRLPPKAPEEKALTGSEKSSTREERSIFSVRIPGERGVVLFEKEVEPSELSSEEEFGKPTEGGQEEPALDLK